MAHGGNGVHGPSPPAQAPLQPVQPPSKAPEGPKEPAAAPAPAPARPSAMPSLPARPAPRPAAAPGGSGPSLPPRPPGAEATSCHLVAQRNALTWQQVDLCHRLHLCEGSPHGMPILMGWHAAMQPAARQGCPRCRRARRRPPAPMAAPPRPPWQGRRCRTPRRHLVPTAAAPACRLARQPQVMAVSADLRTRWFTR